MLHALSPGCCICYVNSIFWRCQSACIDVHWTTCAIVASVYQWIPEILAVFRQMLHYPVRHALLCHHDNMLMQCVLIFLMASLCG